MLLSPKQGWFAAFTVVFAVLAAFVFWGTWSTDFAPVMPDCTTVHPTFYANAVEAVLRKFVAEGKFIPSDVFWDGLVVSPYFCQELKYALALYCSGLALAWFLSGRGLSPLASCGAGLLLAFCGYWSTLFSAGHGGWFVWMTYGVFAFGLIDRAIDRGRLRHWALLGAMVAWGSFYQPDLWLLFTVLTGAYFLFRLIRARKFPWKGIVLAGVVCAAVGAPSFYGAFTGSLAGRDAQIAAGETVSGADKVDDAEKRWIFATNWSLPPVETVEFLVPRVNGDTSCPLTLTLANRSGRRTRPYTGALGRPKDAREGNYRQHSLYVGFVTCLFALVGLVALAKGTKDRPVLCFFAAVAFVCWLFSLGRYCEPVYRLVYALPFGDYLRAPVKWHHLTEFALCVIAGYGIDWLSSRLRFAYAPLALAAVVLVGVIDLARVDRLYCAPTDLAEARRQNCSQQMTFLRRGDFANPQVKAMVQAKKIVALGQPNPETYLVGILGEKPFAKAFSRPLPPFTFVTALGFVSLAASLFAILFGLSMTGTCRRKSPEKGF